MLKANAAPRDQLKHLIDHALKLSDAMGETVVGCYLQMAMDKLTEVGPADPASNEVDR